MSTIQPVEVKRCELGFWTHPQFPDDGEDEGVPKSWFQDNGLELAICELEYARKDIADRYFDSGDPDCSYWEPEKPEGEGWFVFSIHDSDDGPICVWVRHLQ